MKLKEGLTLLFFGTKKPRKIHYVISPIFLLIFIWFGIICYPNMLFAHSIEQGQFKIHSMRLLDREKLTIVLNRVTAKIQRSEIYDKNNFFNIFLCDNTNWGTFLHPFQRNIYFAWTNPISKNAIILKADVDRDLCYSLYAGYEETPLSNVVAHELCHILQFRELGFLGAREMETWKNEGYAEHIAIGNEFKVDEAKLWIKKFKSDNSTASRYINSYIAVSYLMNQRKWTYRKLTESSVTLQQVLDDIEKEN